MDATTILLRNAHIVLRDRTTHNSSLLIQGGRIASVIESPTSHQPTTDEVIDLAGFTLYPGFIDGHIHGAVGVDTMEASASDLDRVSQFLATRGVTGWMPTLVPAPNTDYERSIKAIHYGMKSNSGARILGVHYEGPFVSYAQCGALRAQFFQTYSGPADLDLLPIPLGGTARRMITVAPEIDGGLELVRELTGGGWIVSVGHTRAEIDVLNRAFEAGARHMTHFMNAMPPLHHRAPGPVGWGLSREDVTCDVIADGIHLDPFVLRFLLKTKGSDRLVLISDAIAAAGKGDGAYEIWGERISVKNGRTSNAGGSIAGSVIAMIDGVRMMLSLGASEVDVARMASTNPARLLGLDGERGSIEEGKRADLVALDPHGNVRLTVVGGSIAFQKE